MRYVLIPLFFVDLLSAAVITPLASRPLDDAAQTLQVIPHVVDGGYWKTSFKFVNLDSQPASLSLLLIGEDGSQMQLPFLANADMGASTQSAVQIDLEPAESITLETAGTATSLTSGWAIVGIGGTNHQIATFAIFRQHVPGGQDQEATVDVQTFSNPANSSPTSGPATSSSVMLFDNTAYVTGLAVANPNPPYPLSVVIRDQDGNIIDRQILALQQGGHVAFSVPDHWPSTRGKAGSLQFLTYGHGTAVLGLRFNGAAFTTFDVFQSLTWPTTQ